MSVLHLFALPIWLFALLFAASLGSFLQADKPNEQILAAALSLALAAAAYTLQVLA